jgi:hypothetical protein
MRGDGAEIDLDASAADDAAGVAQSVLGLDLGARADALGSAARTAATYMIAPYGWSAPRGGRRPARRRARAASGTFHRLAETSLPPGRHATHHWFAR